MANLRGDRPDVLLVGGGTLGSVTPLLALAEELQRDCGIRWWGTRHGPERALIAAAGIPFRSIPAGKLRRYWDIRNIADLVVIAWAFVVAIVRFARARPNVVVGAGSYAQVPVAWAAAVLRVPVVILQLDVRPGLANRLVAHVARYIVVAFEGTSSAFRSHRVSVIGIPVRTVVRSARALDARDAKRRLGFSGDRPLLLVLGGGTGAQAVNELIGEVLPKLVEHADVLHVTGRGKGGALGGQRYRHVEFLTNEMPTAYAAADLVVSRAGMGTIAELGVLGKPAILIPMPGTHQEGNASALAAAGAAVVWDQRMVDARRFADGVRELLGDPQRLREYATRVRALFPEYAASRFAEVVRMAIRTRTNAALA